jgi:hypothetical protein
VAAAAGAHQGSFRSASAFALADDDDDAVVALSPRPVPLSRRALAELQRGGGAGGGTPTSERKFKPSAFPSVVATTLDDDDDDEVVCVSDGSPPPPPPKREVVEVDVEEDEEALPVVPWSHPRPRKTEGGAAGGTGAARTPAHTPARTPAPASARKAPAAKLQWPGNEEEDEGAGGSDDDGPDATAADADAAVAALRGFGHLTDAPLPASSVRGVNTKLHAHQLIFAGWARHKPSVILADEARLRQHGRMRDHPRLCVLFCVLTHPSCAVVVCADGSGQDAERAGALPRLAAARGLDRRRHAHRTHPPLRSQCAHAHPSTQHALTPHLHLSIAAGCAQEPAGAVGG